MSTTYRCPGCGLLASDPFDVRDNWRVSDGGSLVEHRHGGILISAQRVELCEDSVHLPTEERV